MRGTLPIRKKQPPDEPRAYAVSIVRGSIELWNTGKSKAWQTLIVRELRDGLAVAAPEFATLTDDEVREALSWANPDEGPKNLLGKTTGGRGKPGPVAVVARLAVACDAWGARALGFEKTRTRIGSATNRQL